MTDTTILPAPTDDVPRVDALRRYRILDTPPEEAFDAIARLAAQVCPAPVARIGFVDGDRQWVKSAVGLGLRETPLELSLAVHAMLAADLLVVPDTTKDEPFARGPLFASHPYLAAERSKRSEEWLHRQREWLRVTAASVGDAAIATDTDTDGRITFRNGVAEALTGRRQDEAAGRPLRAVIRIVDDESRNGHRADPAHGAADPCRGGRTGHTTADGRAATGTGS